MSNMFQKIKFLQVLIICLGYAIRHGRAVRLPKQAPKTVLVTQLAWLGDMVCTTPMFRAIKNKYPQCRVIVLGAARNEGLLANNRDVDRYIVWNDSVRDLKRELSTEKIDFACLATPNFLSLAAIYLSGVPAITVPEIRGGFCPHETKSFRLLRKLMLKATHTMGQYAPREYLRLLEPIGIFSEDTTKHLAFSDQAKNKIDKFISGISETQSGNSIQGRGSRKIRVAVSPSCGNKIKNWDPKRFAIVADFLIEKYDAQIFIIGSKMDTSEVNKMISNSPKGSSYINTMGQFSLDELMAFMAKMDLFIAVDTGPIYIAEAFDVPTIDIVGGVDEREQPPKGEKHISIVAPSRPYPLIHIMNSRIYDPALAKKAVEDIDPEMIFKAIESLYPLIKEALISL